MIDYEGEVTINVPVEKVFRVLTDAGKYDMFTEMHDTRLASGSALDRVGAQLETVVMKKKMLFEVSAFEPNRRIAFKSVSKGGMQWNAEYRLESRGASSTRLQQSGQLRFGGIMGLLEPFMRGEVRKSEQKEIEKLKELLETNKM